MNMTAVTVNTNMDKPKMVCACGEAGARIFVELKGSKVIAMNMRPANPAESIVRPCFL
jgi:hypothetical protein